MKHNILIFTVLPLLAGCSHLEGFLKKDEVGSFKLDQDDYAQAILRSEDHPPIVEHFSLGRLQNVNIELLEPVENDIPELRSPSLSPHQAISQANAQAIVTPDSDNFLNAIQVYPYSKGALYQIYTAPEQVTDVALQPGEKLTSVSAGDTVRWVLGDTISGQGRSEQVHILVKPIEADLKTNLIITTSKRTYHAEMKSFKDNYMAGVSWRYPSEDLMNRKAAEISQKMVSTKSSEPQLNIDKLKFRYEIKGDDPHWRPVQAFDDGRKVYIQFPSRLDQGEAPPLFVVGHDGESQLVNYRIKGAYYVVDRLFGAAELRLGEKKQQVVRIIRRPETPTKMVKL